MQKSYIILITLLILIIGIFGVTKMTGNVVQDSNKVKIQTNYGDIIVELYPNKAPLTVENFKTYVKEGFYDETIFQRVIDGFMIQGGGYNLEGIEKPTHEPIKLESNNGLSNNRGTIAMARTSNPNSATAQFFINVANNFFLDYGYRDEGYAVFGKVIDGMNVADEISKLQTDYEDKPLKNVVIKKIEFI
ncbi:MAG: peptidylprolyl isomerase [Nanoarchaeota archaeon]|nr:peptidylprolyl isomerase [Nanoarchaeota archaeon]